MSTDGDNVRAGQDMYGLYIKTSSVSLTESRWFMTRTITFVELVRRALADLRSKEIGAQLVDLICDQLKQQEKTIVIAAAGGKEGQTGSGWDREN